MKRNRFDERRDAAIANEYHDERELLCSAPGCGNRWTVRVDGQPAYCRQHAFADAQTRRNGPPAHVQQWLDANARSSDDDGNDRVA